LDESINLVIVARVGKSKKFVLEVHEPRRFSGKEHLTICELFQLDGDARQLPAGFKHFDYVNPNAPKGGHVGATRAFNQNFLTFNSLNIFILKGDGAQGMELTFASLMARAADEPDALYGLAARAVRISADGLTYRFLMRPGITFHDGSPLTAHDVAFSLKILKEKGHPIAQQLLRDFVGAEAPDETTVVVRPSSHRALDAPAGTPSSGHLFGWTSEA
jgi:ABC-type oligopeptide transport system substrate-binding subunit